MPWCLRLSESTRKWKWRWLIIRSLFSFSWRGFGFCRVAQNITAGNKHSLSLSLLWNQRNVFSNRFQFNKTQICFLSSQTSFNYYLKESQIKRLKVSWAVKEKLFYTHHIYYKGQINGKTTIKKDLHEFNINNEEQINNWIINNWIITAEKGLFPSDLQRFFVILNSSIRSWN